MSLTRDQVIDYLSALPPDAMRELVAELEDLWGIELVQLRPYWPPHMGMPLEETYERDVVLLGVASSGSKIALVKAVRYLNGSLSLKAAKELVDTCPNVIREALTIEEAEALRDALEEAGGRVELREAGR
ncbi:MAG: ribosomal protein L7/L12 [Myxococcales bacterium]|nr:ribosomal protein L7/L12 [Myxococcales bacterium]